MLTGRAIQIVVGASMALATAATGASAQDPVASEMAFQRAAVEYQNQRFDAAAAEAPENGAIGIAVPYLRGLSRLASGNGAGAVADLERVVAHPSAPPEAAVDLASALLLIGENGRALALLESHAARFPDDPYSRFLLGTARFRAGQYEQATRDFAQAETAPALRPSIADYRRRMDENRPYDPSTEPPQLFRTEEGRPTMEPAASRGMEPMTPQARPRPWHLSIISAFEYDSNVPLSPDIVGLGAPTQIDDNRFVIASFGDFLLWGNDRSNLGLLIQTFDSFHFDLDQFNAQDYSGGFYANRAIGAFLLGINYQYHETLVNNTKFAGEHRLVPNISLLEGNFGHTTVYYEFDKRDVDAIALIPAQFQSGEISRVGVTQAIYLPRDGRLFFGYRYDDADTEGADYVMTGHTFSARVEYSIFQGLVFDAEFRSGWDDYANPNSLDFFGLPRSDTRQEVRTGLQKYFGDHFSLRLDYTYITNDSNVANLFDVEFFTYDRHMVSGQVIYTF